MIKIKIESINSININKKLCNKLFNEEKSEITFKAWSLLNELLIEENIDLFNEDIFYNEFGKPYLLSKKIFFNISHSKSLIAIIISDKECGIDIQFIDYSKDHIKYVNKLLSIEELEQYKIQEDKISYFYKQWSKKEAYFKYIGTGIKLKNLNIEVDNIKTEEITINDEKYVLSYL